MSTPLEDIRRLLVHRDTTVVNALAVRALCGRAPDGFYSDSRCHKILPPAQSTAMAPFAETIIAGYINKVIPLLEPPVITHPTDSDTVLRADSNALSALTVRLELSLQVAACKLDGKNTALHNAAANGDKAAVETLITYPSVEQLVLLRIRSRTADYIRTHNVPPALASRLPATLHSLYATWLIPLSRAIQAAWLIDAATKDC